MLNDSAIQAGLFRAMSRRLQGLGGVGAVLAMLRRHSPPSFDDNGVLGCRAFHDSESHSQGRPPAGKYRIPCFGPTFRNRRSKFPLY